MSLQAHAIEQMARRLAEADGNDPDRLMFRGPLERVRDREGYYVPDPSLCIPVWETYRALAFEALQCQMEMQV